MKKLAFVEQLFLLALASAAQGDDSPSVGTLRIFPPDNAWNWDISNHPIHPNSANFVNSVGAGTSLHPDFGTVWEGAPMGIPYVVIGAGQTLVAIEYTAFGDESDAGPFPIPLNAPVEGGDQSDGDRHVIAVDTSTGKIYELYRAFAVGSHWEAQSGAEWDLASNAQRTLGWTSADAAGLPVFPGLVRYEEVISGEITHAIRMTVRNSQRAYIYPASHFASSSTNPDYPPMGLRFRLKANYDISGFPPSAQVVLRAMKKHGLIVADNGGNWYFSGAPDSRWSDDELNTLKRVKGSDLEAVLTVDSNGEPLYPSSISSQLPRYLTASEASNHPQGGAYGFDLSGRTINSLICPWTLRLNGLVTKNLYHSN